MNTQSMIMANELFVRMFQALNPERLIICKGRRDIKLGQIEFVSAEPVLGKTLIVIAEVTSVRYCKLDNVCTFEWRSDRFRSFFDFLDNMKRYYPDINVGDEVSIIQFDNPVLHNIEHAIAAAVSIPRAESQERADIGKTYSQKLVESVGQVGETQESIEEQIESRSSYKH